MIGQIRNKSKHNKKDMYRFHMENNTLEANNTMFSRKR